MADALGSGPSGSNPMQVQLLLSAPKKLVFLLLKKIDCENNYKTQAEYLKNSMPFQLLLRLTERLEMALNKN